MCSSVRAGREKELEERLNSTLSPVFVFGLGYVKRFPTLYCPTKRKATESPEAISVLSSPPPLDHPCRGVRGRGELGSARKQNHADSHDLKHEKDDSTRSHHSLDRPRPAIPTSLALGFGSHNPSVRSFFSFVLPSPTRHTQRTA